MPVWKKGGSWIGPVEGVDPNAQGDADMPVADLGGIDDFGVPAPAVVEGEQAVGQDHEPAAEPAEVLGADEAVVDVGQPVHEPVGAEVDGVGADGQHGQVEGQHPAKGLVLADVALEHVEDVEALPEEEQADEDQAVAGVEPAFARQGPDGAGEEQDGGEGQQEGEPVDLVFLGVGLLAGLVLLTLAAGSTFMPQRMVGRPMSRVMLVTLLTSELVTTSAPGPPLAPSTKAKIRLPMPEQ